MRSSLSARSFSYAGRGADARALCWGPAYDPRPAPTGPRALHFARWGGDDALFVAGRCAAGGAAAAPVDWAAARAPRWFLQPLREALAGASDAYGVVDRNDWTFGDCWLERGARCRCSNPALTASEASQIRENLDFDLCTECPKARRLFTLDETKASLRALVHKSQKKQQIKQRKAKGKGHHGSSARPYSQKRK